MNISSEQQQRFRADHSRLVEYLQALSIVGKTLIFLGIVSNLLVCLVMVRGRKRFKASVANFLILHLAIADLVFRAGGIAAGIADGLNKKLLSPSRCKAVIFSQGSCAAAMFFLLTEIAIDRYLHVVHPLRSLRLRWPKVKTILSTWLAAFIVCSPLLFTATNKRFVRTYNVFANNSQNRSRNQPQRKVEIVFDLQTDDCVTGNATLWTTRMATAVYIFFAFLIPIIVITVSYGKILVFLWRRKRMGTINSAVARSRYKATRMLIVVVISGLISWGPLTFMDTVQAFYGTHLYVGELPLRPLLISFSFTSSVLNCGIYAFGNSSFRREMKRLYSPCLNRCCAKRIT